MVHLYEKRPVFPWRGIVITVLVFLAVILLFTLLMTRTNSSTEREQTELLERALRNAAVTSYSVEGCYPPTLERLIEQYGVIVDERRFLVRYDVFAPNIMPSISVVVKGAPPPELAGGEVVFNDF